MYLNNFGNEFLNKVPASSQLDCTLIFMLPMYPLFDLLITIAIILPGGPLCVLYSDHGGVLGDRGCGVSRHSSSAIGSLPLVWGPGF